MVSRWNVSKQRLRCLMCCCFFNLRNLQSCNIAQSFVISCSAAGPELKPGWRRLHKPSKWKRCGIAQSKTTKLIKTFSLFLPPQLVAHYCTVEDFYQLFEQESLRHKDTDSQFYSHGRLASLSSIIISLARLVCRPEKQKNVGFVVNGNVNRRQTYHRLAPLRTARLLILKSPEEYFHFRYESTGLGQNKGRRSDKDRR